MYNLKKVFGIISFEEGAIKVLVLDSANKEQPKYLFYDKIDLEYSYDFSNIVNTENIEKAISKLTRRADEFIGLVVSNYIINIPALNANPIRKISPNFPVIEGYCSEQLKYGLIDKVSLLNQDAENICIANDIIKWNVDGKQFDNYPTFIPGNTINYEYVTYACPKYIYKIIQNILNNAKVNALAFVSNQNINNCMKNQVYVDVNKNDVSIYYNNERKVLNLSYNNIVEYINSKIGGDVKSIKWINHTLDLSKNSPVINLYDGSYLTYQEVCSKHINKLVKNYIQDFLNSISQEIDNFVGFNNIIINGDDNFIELLKKIELDTKFVIANKNNSVCLSNQNVSSMLYAYEYVNNKQIAYSKNVTYSVESFIDQALISKEANQNLFVKIGIASTRWAAKLG